MDSRPPLCVQWVAGQTLIANRGTVCTQRLSIRARVILDQQGCECVLPARPGAADTQDRAENSIGTGGSGPHNQRKLPMRRMLFIAAAAVTLVLGATPAHADKPLGGCPNDMWRQSVFPLNW